MTKTWHRCSLKSEESEKCVHLIHGQEFLLILGSNISQWTGKSLILVHNSLDTDMLPVDMFAIFSLRRPNILPVGKFPLVIGLALVADLRC